MSLDINIALKATHINEVKKALEGIRDTIANLEGQATKITETASKRRIKIYQAEAAERKKLAQDAGREISGVLGGGTDSASALLPTRRKKQSSAPKSFFENLQEESGTVKGIVGGFNKLATIAGAAGAAISLFSKGIDVAMEGLQMFSGFLINDVVKPAFTLETFATQTENATNGQIKANELMEKARSIQIKYNIDAQKAAESIAEVTDKTGDAKLAMGLGETFAQLNKGYGVDTGQLAGLTGAMYKEGMGAEDIKGMLFTQLKQGMEGKITLKEIAGLGGTFSEKAGLLGGDSRLKYATLGAGLQAGGITGKAETSMNNLNKFIEEVAGGKLGAGSKAAKGGQVLDLGAAIREALVKSKGDASAFMGKMHFAETSSSFLQQFSGSFKAELEKNGGDLNKAAQAATSSFEEMRLKTMNEAAVKEAAAKVMKTAGEKLEQSINKIKMRMVESMPAINKFVDALAEKAPALASAAITLTSALIKLAGWIADHFGTTDTREKRKEELEGKKTKLDENVAIHEKEIARLQAGKARAEGDPASEKYYDDQIALEEEKKKKAEETANVGKKALDDEYNKKVEGADLEKEMIEASKKDARLGGNEGDRIKSAKDMFAELKSDPSEFDVNSAEGTKLLPKELKAKIEKYRDQQLDQMETGAKGAGKAMADLIPTIEAARKAMDKMADSAGDASKSKPISDR